MRIVLSFIFVALCFNSYSQEKDLTYFIATAEKNSPLLKDYTNQIQSATLDSLINLASRKPQINGVLFGNYSPIINNFGYDTTLSNGQTFSGLVGVNQKIIGQNRRTIQSQTFKLVKEGFASNKKIALKDLKKVIISQYISAIASSNELENNRKIANVLKEEAQILKKLAQNSVYKQTDYLLFSATVKQQELSVLQLKQQYQNDLGMLHYLAGEADTTFVYLKSPEITLRSNLKDAKKLFFKPFEIDSLKLQNQNALIDIAYKPSFSFLADAGYMSTFTNLPYKNLGFSLGFGLTVPIYDGNQRKLQHQKIASAFATNTAYKNNFEKQYQQQLLILNQKLKQVSEIENQLKSQLSIAETLIEANKKLLLTGDAQITEFVIAINSFITIQNSISQNNINKLLLINEINYWSYND
jgi:outer membrane protein TolC